MMIFRSTRSHDDHCQFVLLVVMVLLMWDIYLKLVLSMTVVKILVWDQQLVLQFGPSRCNDGPGISSIERLDIVFSIVPNMIVTEVISVVNSLNKDQFFWTIKTFSFF